MDDPPPASGIEDCGPFKKIWSYRYLCYNLGKEILCLLCFCRFTQFKKFNLDRHMRNKHPHLYIVEDDTKKKMLDIVSNVLIFSVEPTETLTKIIQYVARYEENVTPGMIASVPSQGNEQMAATILQASSQQSFKRRFAKISQSSWLKVPTGTCIRNIRIPISFLLTMLMRTQS